MDQTALLTALRAEIGDKEQPYRYNDKELLEFVQSAVYDYSQYRPRRRRGILNIQPEVLEYTLPADFQTWVVGLEAYEVLDNILYLNSSPVASYSVAYTYLGNHDIASMPEGALSLILDFCTWKLFSDAVREGSEISELKLGKGLDIKFDNFDQINELADKRRNSYLAAVTKPVGGVT
ncbi:hypothetical protein [Paenibacillus oleatilyticus]|uniref:hypothetical protein n=1 Tax=Paenibacillus oleatilyticus TaxID=2594886 RepID=UPI001C1FF9C8|nr:hypothetical protein [Paenibacillus oleatilyticus]MBU7314057.1 hypothetical protein [Paenibacillus oleatilyticus]